MANRLRRLARVATVILIAAGSGHFVQTADSRQGIARSAAAVPDPVSAARPVEEGQARANSVAAAADVVPVPAGTVWPPFDPAPSAAIVAREVDETAAAPDDRKAPLPPGPGTDLVAAPPAEGPIPAVFDASAAPADPIAAAPAADPCGESLAIVAEPGAMLALSLEAPCRAGAPVILHHAGLTVSARLSGIGGLALRMPALDAGGAVAVRFMDGHRLEAAAPVGDLGGLTRVAVQWSAVDAFALHAFAPGAQRDGTGHVSASRPGRPDGPAGWLATLGDAGVPAPVLAEVYTFPADRDGVLVEIEAALTPSTCGREVMAELIEWTDGRILRRDLVIPMPDCGEGEGFLVLQNPFDDRKLAAN